MSDSKKVPIIIPDGIPWPSDVPVPEIEVAEARIRKTLIDKDGNIQEITSTVALPVIPEGNNRE